VLTNEPQADLVLQLSGELKLDDAAPSTQTALTGRGYARYTADGKLVWFRSTRSLTGSDKVGAESALALVPPSDFALSYVAPNVQTEPVVPTSSYRLARVDASSGELTWQAKYPSNFLNGIPLLVVRSTQGDFLTFYPAQSRSLPGEACRAMDNGTSASVTCSGSSYAIGAVSGVDGTSAWIWGAPGIDGAASSNPLSASQWPFTSNPQRFGGEEAFILGLRGASTTVGPWMTEGDYGPGLMLAALPGGDLAVTAQGNGYVAFNGGQTLLEQAGSVLFRLDATTCHVVWRTPLALGDYSSAFDFDPGTGTDQPSSSRGVYISRYSF